MDAALGGARPGSLAGLRPQDRRRLRSASGGAKLRRSARGARAVRCVFWRTGWSNSAMSTACRTRRYVAFQNLQHGAARRLGDSAAGPGQPERENTTSTPTSRPRATRRSSTRIGTSGARHAAMRACRDSRDIRMTLQWVVSNKLPRPRSRSSHAAHGQTQRGVSKRPVADDLRRQARCTTFLDTQPSHSRAGATTMFGAKSRARCR